MKRISKLGIIVVLVIVCLVGTSCNKAKIKEKPDPAVTTSTEGEEKESSTSKDETVKDGEHPFNTYDDYTCEVLVDITPVDYGFNFPGGTTRCGSGFSHVNNEKDLFVLCNQYQGDDMTTPEDGINIENITSSDVILEEMKKDVVTTIGFATVAKIEDMTIASKENIEVNGWDMCRYEGKIIRNKEDAEFASKETCEYSYVAYTVIKDDCPIYLIAVDKSEGQKNVSLVAEMADKVATTFRENEYGVKRPND